MADAMAGDGDPLVGLLAAANRGDPAGVAAILDRNPSLIDRRGMLPGHAGLRTALHFGALHAAVVKLLLDRGADMTIEDAVGVTPLDVAALDENDDAVRALLDAGASLTLPAAIALGREADVENIVAAHAEVLSGATNRWARLLVYASGRASARILERLLRTAMRHRAGLSIVNMADDVETAPDGARGYTALHAAAFHGNDEAVSVLLRHGANPRARDQTYCATPAGWAARAGHAATAGVILDADVDLFDAIDFDRGDLVGRILDRDPSAIDRPLSAYAPCGGERGRSDATPFEWATSQQKPHAIAALVERGAATRSAADRDRAQRVVTFLQSACWDHHVHGKADHRLHDRAAQRLLAADASLAREDLYTAIVCGESTEVERRIAANPALARERGGARGWTPILYLAYTRFTHPPTLANALAIARVLLDHGADPNDFYMAGDSPYTPLVGAAGEGEQDAPRQPYGAALFDLLLERGANPFDLQVVYDTHFSGDMLWWLELVYNRTSGTAREQGWRDPEWPMFDMAGYGSGARFVLETSVKKGNGALAEWALAHGANPNAAPARDWRFPKLTLYDLAIAEGEIATAALLLRYGAVPSALPLDDDVRFAAACSRLDREAALTLLDAHPEYRQSSAVLFAAARRNRTDVLALLIDLGFSIELENEGGTRALHEVAYHGADGAVRFLLERGAEVDPHDRVYDSTPLGWATHAGRPQIVDRLSRSSRDIRRLCFNGYVDRVREVLADDPSLAHVAAADGHTPLWWLPDDDERARAIVELLLAAGADPAARTREGRTAADWARRRGMYEIAEQLDKAAAARR